MTSHHFNIETTGVAQITARINAQANSADTFAKLAAKGKLDALRMSPGANCVSAVHPHTLSTEASQ